MYFRKLAHSSLVVQISFCLLWIVCLGFACSDQNSADSDLSTTKSRPWVPDQFAQNHPMSDSFFQDYDALSEQGVQTFFEESPYGRSWLANFTANGKLASKIVFEQAQRYKINPIVLLSRMQVESSLVAAANKPAQHLIDRAMGCACPDGQACGRGSLGFERQITCGAQKFRELFDLSANGSGWWRKGLGKSTLDGYWIVPQSHASASLYAYTPWVLVGSGGTWLAWKTARLFDSHIYDNRIDQINSGRNSGGSTSNESCDNFTDVGSEHPAYTAINQASAHQWISGCGQNEFCPDKSLTRAEAAVIITKAFEIPTRSSGSFDDIQGHWAKSAIESLHAENIMSGCTADLFCPDEILTRAQAAVMIAKAGNVNGGWHNHPYQDIADDHWASPYISALDAKGYIGGCSDTEFCLDAPMRRWIFVTWIYNVVKPTQISCR